MLRRLKETVEKGLPPKLETTSAARSRRRSCSGTAGCCSRTRPCSARSRRRSRGRAAAGGGGGGGGDGAAAVGGDTLGRAAPSGGCHLTASLMNTLMQLRKCCDHPYLFEGAEDDPGRDAARGARRGRERQAARARPAAAQAAREAAPRRALLAVRAHDRPARRLLRLRGWNYTRLTGATNRVQRMVNVQSFNARARARSSSS